MFGMCVRACACVYPSTRVNVTSRSSSEGTVPVLAWYVLYRRFDETRRLPEWNLVETVP